jgi:uncharacterized protein (DUF2336 family)
MPDFRSLISELEEVIAHGSEKRRTDTLKRITRLFLDGASRFNEEHVDLFDQVFSRLVEAIEVQARAELSHCLAPVGNAPRALTRRLATDDDIAVARPVLQRSPRLSDTDLVDIAETKSQEHLLAIADRAAIAEPVTDVLVRRGNQDVVRNVAGNEGASLSERGFSMLATRAERDDLLAEKIVLRPDIPPALFRDLLLKAKKVVQERLLATARPRTRAEIKRVLAKISRDVGSRAWPRDFTAARATVEALHRERKLDEAALVGFAQAGCYEETVMALAVLCQVPADVVDRLMSGDRPDPILILCKSAGWGWPTVRTIIMARLGDKRAGRQALDTAESNFERLSPATAQRVMSFWQAKPLRGAAAG